MVWMEKTADESWQIRWNFRFWRKLMNTDVSAVIFWWEKITFSKGWFECEEDDLYGKLITVNGFLNEHLQETWGNYGCYHETILGCWPNDPIWNWKYHIFPIYHPVYYSLSFLPVCSGYFIPFQHDMTQWLAWELIVAILAFKLGPSWIWQCLGDVGYNLAHLCGGPEARNGFTSLADSNKP